MSQMEKLAAYARCQRELAALRREMRQSGQLDKAVRLAELNEQSRKFDNDFRRIAAVAGAWTGYDGYWHRRVLVTRYRTRPLPGRMRTLGYEAVLN